jgi:hypothetical protein
LLLKKEWWIYLSKIVKHIKDTYYFVMSHTDITCLLITYVILMYYIGSVLDFKTYIKGSLIVFIIYYIPLFYLMKKHKYIEYLKK